DLRSPKNPAIDWPASGAAGARPVRQYDRGPAHRAGSLPFPALEILSIGNFYNWRDGSEAVDKAVANLDLGRFLHLRIVEQYFVGRKIKYFAGDNFWNAPYLEFLRLRAKFDGELPTALAKAESLRALECDLEPASMGSALDLLPRLPRLGFLSLYFGS